MNGIWGSIALVIVFVVGVAATSPLRAAQGTSANPFRVPAVLAVRKDLGALEWDAKSGVYRPAGKRTS